MRNTLNDPKKQDRGSPEPVPGRCGAKLKRSDPPRYCMKYPMKGETRCERCGGKTLRGAANPAFKHGRHVTQFDAALPAGLRKHIDQRRVKDIASCDQQLLLVDARTGEVLESMQRHDPTGVVRGAQMSLAATRLFVEAGDVNAAAASLDTLAGLLDAQAAIASGWDELHRLFDTRVKLAAQQTRHEKFLSENIALGQIATFMAALVAEARILTDDRQKLSAYASRVKALGSGLVGPLLEKSEDVVEAEYVEEEKGGED